jgi:hypothetical protein
MGAKRVALLRAKPVVAVAAFALVSLAIGLGRSAAAGWWQPPQRLTWYWQLQGRIKNTQSVAVYDVDGFETSAAEVAALHAEGKHVICYIDVGTAENWRPDYGSFPEAVLGAPDEGFPNERWLDIRQLGVLEPIMERRFAMCREKGFDAIEPDNIEGYANASGFPLSAQQQLTYNEWVAGTVHSFGMAVFQKNDPEQTSQLQALFDGALVEQCNQFHECASYEPYLQAGKPVLDAEYRVRTRKFCAADAALGIMGARLNVALNGRRFQHCW